MTTSHFRTTCCFGSEIKLISGVKKNTMSESWSPCAKDTMKIGAVFLVLFVIIIVGFLGPRQCYEYLNGTVMQSECKKCDIKTIVPIDKDEVMYDNAQLTNAFMNPSKNFFRQWHLARVDSGGFSFEVCAPNGGLVVYLVDNPNDKSLSDSHGYAIVLDNQRDPPETYISSVPGFPSKHPKSKINKGFRLNADANSCAKYWVVYDKGSVLVGSGGTPGEEGAKLITCLTNDDMASTGLYYFGFGLLSKDEEVGVSIKNIRTFDAPDSGCKWSAMVPQQCSDLSTVHK